MRAGTVGRCADDLGTDHPTGAAMALIEAHVHRFGPPPDPARTVLASDGCDIPHGTLLAELRAARDGDACRCADALKALPIPAFGACRVILGDGSGRGRTARALLLSAPGGDA